MALTGNNSIKVTTRAPVMHRETVNRGPDVGQSQVGTPLNETQPPRAGYMEVLFDVDGYALTHGRHLFAASQWLGELIGADVKWPTAANTVRDYLTAKGHTTDHVDAQIVRLEPLFAPWLAQVRRVPGKAD